MAAATPPEPQGHGWLTIDVDQGPLCAQLAEGAKRRLDAVERAFGPEYVEGWLSSDRAQTEAFFCLEDEKRAWAVSVAGLEASDEATSRCTPDLHVDKACFERARRAMWVAVRTLEAGQESVTCWAASAERATPCQAGADYFSFLSIGALFHDVDATRGDLELVDLDGDGRAELVLSFQDNNRIDPHGWYVALHTKAPGRPVEEHPAFIKPSVVGFFDVNDDGRRDLVTRASSRHCSDEVDPRHPDRSICHGRDATVLCRLATERGFGAPRACPPGPDGPPGGRDRGWSGLLTGR